VSWKALDWATDSAVGSSTTKFILLLLANKADENFSCYPSIRTLMAESDAGRSTVMRALNELEARGFITRQCGSPEIVEGFLCRFRLGLGFPDLVVDG
jgi:pyocin large subunit-like protein